MEALKEKTIGCPYCGETITVLLDCSVPDQTYVEDCQVCCQPIVFDVSDAGGDEISLSVRREND